MLCVIQSCDQAPLIRGISLTFLAHFKSQDRYLTNLSEATGPLCPTHSKQLHLTFQTSPTKWRVFESTAATFGRACHDDIATDAAKIGAGFKFAAFRVRASVVPQNRRPQRFTICIK